MLLGTDVKEVNKEFNMNDLQITSQKAIEMLKTGNERFIKGQTIQYNYMKQVYATSKNQKPFAAILSCMDSRLPAPIIFDQGIGNVFSICIAGNCVNNDILGSLELACVIGNVKLIVVVGHNECSAIKSACDNLLIGNITHTVLNIKPAIIATGDILANTSYSEKDFIQAVAKKHVELTIEKILKLSEVLQRKISDNDLNIIGAMYDVYTGHVDFD
mgnify:CR=1 FL=1